MTSAQSSFSYLVKELLSCCIWLNGKFQFSIHRGDSYTYLRTRVQKTKQKYISVILGIMKGLLAFCVKVIVSCFTL